MGKVRMRNFSFRIRTGPEPRGLFVDLLGGQLNC
jgi:hypothetical protein